MEKDQSATPGETPLQEKQKSMRQFISENKSVNTTRKTERESKKFINYILDHHGDNTPLEKMKPETLDIYIGEWLMSLSKPDGSNYEPDTLTSFHRSVERYLKDKGYGYSIVSDKEFNMSKEVLQTKRKQLSSLGLGNRPNKSDVITPSDEEILWTSGQLGMHSPLALFNTVWYFNTKLFGFRGGHESRQMKWGDITLHTDTDGDEYLQFRERLSKTRQGNSSVRPFAPKAYCNKEDPTRCPVAAYKQYQYHRPSNYTDADSAFYVALNHSWNDKNRFSWYKNSPMGSKYLGAVMKNMALKAGITNKKLSNHSVRRTMCTTLLQEGVAPNLIAQLSGHKNVGSLQHYSIASTSQQKSMSHILQGMSAPTPTPLSAPKQSTQTPTCTVTQATPSGSQKITKTPTCTVTQATKPAEPYKTSGVKTPTDNLSNLLSPSSLLQQNTFSGSTININIHYGSEHK